MASSEKFTIMDPWAFLPTFGDSWISEAIARDTDTLTRALQKSISNQHGTAVTDAVSPLFKVLRPDSTSAQFASCSGSDPETKRRYSVDNGPAGGKITKRKSRALKRTTTTFITADPANFRQMVQHVTGVRFGGGKGQVPVAPVLKPEPQRLVNRLQTCLPNLDMSDFLLGQHQIASPTSSALFTPSINVPSPSLVADGDASFDFDSFSSFPTLESWRAV